MNHTSSGKFTLDGNEFPSYIGNNYNKKQIQVVT